MKMVRLVIQLPEPLKAKLNTLRQEGITASGFIRHLLEEHFKQTFQTVSCDGEERTVNDGAHSPKRIGPM